VTTVLVVDDQPIVREVVLRTSSARRPAGDFSGS
jgi:CheY-like chemotaxis protein